MLRPIIITTILALSCITFNLRAESFSTYRSAKVELIKIDFELAQRVKPILRTFVSKQGHVATVKGSNYMILADTQKSLDVLRPVLEKLDIATFDQETFRNELNRIWHSRSRPKFNTATIELKKLKAKDVLPAIRSLVSKIGAVEYGTQDNQLIITDFPDYLDEVVRMVTKLDS